jgi:SAM-dependent methyltransferase
MEPGEYEAMYRAEDSMWWYQGMQAITRAVLERTYRRACGLRILDAGCGTGAVMTYLADYGQVSGFDFSADALAFCRKRGLHELTRASVSELPYTDASFDLVVSFDVICVHSVPDDVQALRECARVLREGGRLVLRLPAYNWLHGHHDEAVDIRHRYTAGEMRHKLVEAGLQPEWLSYANTALFPVALAKRLLEKVFPPGDGSDVAIDYGVANAFFKAILSAEAPLVASTGLPFGLTVVVVGRKP